MACISLDTAKEERIGEILSHDLDWEALSLQASRQGVFPLFYRRIKSAGENLIPPAELLRLKKSFIANAHFNLHMAQRLLWLADLFSAAGINFIPLKGPILAAQAYGDLDMRQFGDLDLLIKKEDVAAAYTLLSKNEYVPKDEIDFGQLRLLLDSDHHLLFTQNGDNLEVHWDIAPPGFIFPLNIRQFWQELDTVRILEKDFRILTAENTILLACLHGTKHHWNKLNLIADLSHLIQAYPDFKWSPLLEKVKQAGFLRSLSLSLLLAEDPGGAKLPSDIHELAHVDKAAESLASDIKNKFMIGWHETSLFGDTQYFLRSREHLYHRLYYALDQIFIPKQTEWKDLPLPDPLTILYYAIRPLRLLIKFGWSLFLAAFKS